MTKNPCIMRDCKDRLLEDRISRFFNSPVADRICWGGLLIAILYIAGLVLWAVLK